MQNTNKRTPIRKGDLIIAIVLAFSAWVYVIYSIDPTMARTYKDVPVSFVHEDILAENELAVKSAEFDTVDITVEAKRTMLDSLDASKVQVSADLSDAGKGENVLALNVAVPDGVEVTKKSSDNITVIVEGRVSSVVPVQTSFINLSEDGTEPIVTERSVNEVEITGAESLVRRVTHAQITLDANKITDKAKTFSVKPVPSDKGGNAVGYVTASPDRLSATAVQCKTKTVPLNPVVNNPDSDKGVRKYTAPKTVEIKGLADRLDKIESVDTEKIDLSGIDRTTSIPLTYNLPEGVDTAVSAEGQTLDVKFTPYEVKNVVIGAGDISVVGLGEGLSAEVTGDVKVIVAGEEGELSGIKSGDFTVIADATGVYSTGRHKVRITLSTSVKNAKLSTDTVEITVKDKGNNE